MLIFLCQDLDIICLLRNQTWLLLVYKRLESVDWNKKFCHSTKSNTEENRSGWSKATLETILNSRL